MTIVVKKVPKCLRGIVKLLFGIKENDTKKEAIHIAFIFGLYIYYNNSLIKL